MASNIRTAQILAADGNTLEQELATKLTAASFPNSFGTSLTLPNGDIIKTGAIGASSNIAANGTLDVTVTFATAFPTSCFAFNLLVTPATDPANFYGVVAIIAKSKTAVTVRVKNGSAIQALASGSWMALGN